jgi:hypothetical protein
VNGALRGLVLGLAIAAMIAGCVVNRLMNGPRLTGTCEGACEHYVACKSTHADADTARCRKECPDVFADRDSLMAFESLSCANAVEYIDGQSPKAATVKPLGK